MIKEPQILLLDDSFSAVDTETEEAILQNLRRVFPGRRCSSFPTAFPPSKTPTRSWCWKRVWSPSGVLHEELVAQPGLYQELYHKQLLEEQIESVS